MKARPVEYKYTIKLTTTENGNSMSSELGCSFRTLGDGFEVSFNEASANTLTAIRMCSKGLNGGCRAEIERSGGFSGLMVIEKGMTANCRMHTPYGAADIRVTGGNAEYTLTPNGAEGTIEYTTALGETGAIIKQEFIISKK